MCGSIAIELRYIRLAKRRINKALATDLSQSIEFLWSLLRFALKREDIISITALKAWEDFSEILSEIFLDAGNIRTSGILVPFLKFPPLASKYIKPYVLVHVRKTLDSAGQFPAQFFKNTSLTDISEDQYNIITNYQAVVHDIISETSSLDICLKLCLIAIGMVSPDDPFVVLWRWKRLFADMNKLIVSLRPANERPSQDSVDGHGVLDTEQRRLVRSCLQFIDEKDQAASDDEARQNQLTEHFRYGRPLFSRIDHYIVWKRNFHIEWSAFDDELVKTLYTLHPTGARTYRVRRMLEMLPAASEADATQYLRPSPLPSPSPDSAEEISSSDSLRVDSEKSVAYFDDEELDDALSFV